MTPVRMQQVYGTFIPHEPDRTALQIASALDGVTPTSTQIAQAIRDGTIEVSVLSDEAFESRGEITRDAAASASGNRIFLRKDYPFIHSPAVHEGVHALDYLSGNSASMSTCQSEARAYEAQREFEIAQGEKPKYDTLGQLERYIEVHYGVKDCNIEPRK